MDRFHGQRGSPWTQQVWGKLVIENDTAPLGWWARAADYELRVTGRGTYICPLPGAPIEWYDPWAESVGRTSVPPYVALTRLLDDNPELMRVRGAMVPTLSEDASEPLLEWCRQFGLLGITLHEVRSVLLPKQGDPTDGGEVSREFHWSSGGWMESGSTRHQLGAPFSERADEDAEGVVEYRPIMGHDFLSWTMDPFTAWRDAFPGAIESPGQFEFSPPGGGRFWSDYGESVADFLNAIHSLRDVLDAAEEQKRHGREDRARVATFFNRFVDRVHPIVLPKEPRGWEQRYAAPSLLAILAMMAKDDLTNCSLHRCPLPHGCGRLFRSTAHAAKYCSDTCRSRAAKRRERTS